jgi:hypothetical protein
MQAIERARSARVNAARTKAVEHEIGGAFRRRGHLTADSGYASSTFFSMIDDYRNKPERQWRGGLTTPS